MSDCLADVKTDTDKAETITTEGRDDDKESAENANEKEMVGNVESESKIEEETKATQNKAEIESTKTVKGLPETENTNDKDKDEKEISLASGTAGHHKELEGTAVNSDKDQQPASSEVKSIENVACTDENTGDDSVGNVVPDVETVSLESNKDKEEFSDPQQISQSMNTNNQKETSSQRLTSDSSTPSSNSTDGNSEEKSSSEASTSSTDKHAEHVTYTEDGCAIYTDPATKYQYKWCTKTNNWTPLEAQNTTSGSNTNPYENEHYKWCTETQKWIPKQQAQEQVTETEHYKWDAVKQQWIPKKTTTAATEQLHPTAIVYDIDEDGQRIYTDKDGTVFFWDEEKNAWFPKIDDDFMARYQMSYGFIDNTSASEKEKQQLEEKAAELKQKELQQMTEEAVRSSEESVKGAAAGAVAAKRKAPPEPPKWFEIDPEHNTKVYVSNLPLDITMEEFAEVMGKCGMIMRDPQTQKYKLKLYTEADGQIKGDGLCDYIKVESVHLALKILDEYDLRGHKIRVQPAKFQMRGEYNPALKPKKKKKDKEKMAKIKEKLFDWRPEKMRGERSKHEKTVIIKNLFHPDIFEKEVQLILDYQNDLREECGKCGTVRKVVIYDRHSEGVAQINMASPEEADLVIQMMHGRFFGKRQLKADHWDGKTKYKIEETEEEIQKRLHKWDKYLETDAQKSEVRTEPAADSDDESTVSKDSEKIEEEVLKEAGNA